MGDFRPATMQVKTYRVLSPNYFQRMLAQAILGKGCNYSHHFGWSHYTLIGVCSEFWSRQIGVPKNVDAKPPFSGHCPTRHGRHCIFSNNATSEVKILQRGFVVMNNNLVDHNHNRTAAEAKSNLQLECSPCVARDHARRYPRRS
jgi:hypothetical protein